MIKHEEAKQRLMNINIRSVTIDDLNFFTSYIAEQEKNDVIIQKVKDILALNYSYQEIGFKIRKLFKQLEEELK